MKWARTRLLAKTFHKNDSNDEMDYQTAAGSSTPHQAKRRGEYGASSIKTSGTLKYLMKSPRQFCFYL